ncbi:PREDICTED: protein scarlet-like [Ceratosolen solmsi marchali]|uniref:Protein scarlet-like n=1 Tax=Ceratosolen solmsi marchali TaxID=326594 RepID=A0AAJ7E2T8_9HYME|nr:PREDICTED: protein scarlet-like [Ceratosolen solmsi marchali]
MATFVFTRNQNDVSISQLTKFCLPNEISLSWRNISYKVERRRGGNYLRDFFIGKQIEYVKLLNGVHGIVKSGTLMAIMGPSGAGKTSLLARISLRIKGTVCGEVLLNGKSADTETMSRISGFVPQQDITIESLTVQEHMEFMARMKMDREYQSPLRKQRISVLLTQLGLVKCCSTKLSQLSCGERKRISLAVELLNEPRIIFCDEPTTGLDSFAALTVIKTLRDLANRGCIVICSIHQPASGLLELFHEIIILSSGRLAFQGNTLEALRFLQSLNFECPTTFNIAEFLVKQLSINRERESENLKKVKWICDKFEESIYGQQLVKIISKSVTETLSANSQHKTQLHWLMWRIYIDYKRNLSSICFRFSLYMFIGILLSTPYIGIMKNIDQNGIQSIQGLMYLIITETIFTFNYSVFYTFSNELPLLLRDISNGLYNPAPYYLSKIIITIPGAIIQPLMFISIIYTIVGLNINDYNFFLFLLPVVLSAMSASAVGYLMSAIFKSITTASLFSVPIDFITLIFSGLFLQLGNLAPHIEWLKYTSHFYYGIEAISLTQWREVDKIDCPADPEEPCVSTGIMVLEKYGYKSDHYFIDCLGLIVIFSISHIIGFLAIRIRSNKQPIY